MLKDRIVTALIALSVLLVVLFAAPAPVAEAAIALLALAGAWEWSALAGARTTPARMGYAAVIGLLLAAAYVYLSTAVDELLVAALVWWLAALVWVLLYPTPVPRLLAWLGGAFVLVPLFVALVTLYRSGAENLLFVLLVVWAADIGAFFVGRAFGRVKLAPRISPGKTWEGVLGGLVAVALLATAGSVWFGDRLMALLPFCLAVAGISIIGDLTVSIFKRNAGVKDSGSLFPGHGGVLDRVDSVAAASPIFALGIIWMGLL